MIPPDAYECAATPRCHAHRSLTLLRSASSLHPCTRHPPPPHLCPQHPGHATRHRPKRSQCLHRCQHAQFGRHRTGQRVPLKVPNGDGGEDVSWNTGAGGRTHAFHRPSAHTDCVDTSKPSSVGIVPDRKLAAKPLMRCVKGGTSAGAGRAGSQMAVREPGESEAELLHTTCPTPLPSPRPSPHKAYTPLHQAHVATPRRDDHRPLPLHLPLPLLHHTRTHI